MVSVVLYTILSGIIAFWFCYDPDCLLSILYWSYPSQIISAFCFLFPIALIFQLFIIRHHRPLAMKMVLILYIILIIIVTTPFFISDSKSGTQSEAGAIMLRYLLMAIGMAATPAIILSTVYSHFFYRKLLGNKEEIIEQE